MKSKQASQRQELALAMAVGAAAGRITPARLMSPAELEAAARGRPDLEGRLRGWCLCTEVPGVMWKRALDAHARGAVNQVMVAEAPSRRRYFIIVVQADGWQHRVCIPLLGALTAQWLGSLSSKRLMQMSIADADSDRAFVSESVVPPGAVAQLSGVDTNIPEDLTDFLEESFRLVAWNALAATEEPAARTPLPNEVSLSLLLPAEVEAHLERRADQWEGRKAS